MIKKVTNTVPWAYISKFNVDKINYFPEPYTHSKKKNCFKFVQLSNKIQNQILKKTC